METKPHVVVVGGGLSGLTAAHRLIETGSRVTVLESAPRPGGKLHSSPVAGVPVDSGAESILTRRPEALELVADLGLGDRLTHPAPAPARLYSRGALRDFPSGHLMGVPGGLTALARSGVLSWTGTLRAARDLVWPATTIHADVPVATYIGVRMGSEVVDRLVEPMLGGVYAGRADRLSLEAALPQIVPAARTRRSLMAAVREIKEEQAAKARDAAPGPVFATLRGGLATLIDALVDRVTAAGGAVETSTPVRELRRDGAGWRIVAGPPGAERAVAADAVVLACPAPEAARLLRVEVPEAARELERIGYASMAVITLAYRARDFAAPPKGSGFLVPALEGRTIKAATFSSVKWPWLAEALRAAHPDEETVLVRCSIGRVGEEETLQHSDEELAALAVADLADICGIGRPPVEQRVTRWQAGLPQYTVGHEARIARARTAVAAHPGLALCGAAYDGVGIPACVASATEAARTLTTVLTERVAHGAGPALSD
ncbi:protoporphyrinogen oxidase [Marinactinospora endophytica]